MSHLVSKPTFIVGRSGSDKRLFAAQRILESLLAGRTVVVLDAGSNHASLAKLLGGTTVTFRGTEQPARQQFGTTPLFVFDVEGICAPTSVEQLSLPALSNQVAVVVDETYRVAAQCSDLWAWLNAGAAAGARVTAVLQDLSDVPLAERPVDAAIHQVARHELDVLGGLQPGQMYRHQDGGIYQFDSISKSTVDLTELVNYTHVWPFEQGAKWSRPAHEWPSRFTPITAADLAEARKIERAVAQAAITNAKAARRAAGK